MHDSMKVRIRLVADLAFVWSRDTVCFGPRKEVYAFAEAFAVLVKIEVVAMTGAIATIGMLLKKQGVWY